MGSFFSQPFGGSQQSSQASQSNQAYPYLQGALSPVIGQGTSAGSQIANLLGLNGQQAQNQGFQTFRDSTGYQFGLNQGVKSIVGNAATQGLLNSGGTLQALDTYGQNYANTQYQNYLNPLQNLLGSALQGGGVLAQAGNVFNSSSQGTSTKGGVGTFVGSLLGKPGGGQ